MKSMSWWCWGMELWWEVLAEKVGFEIEVENVSRDGREW